MSNIEREALKNFLLAEWESRQDIPDAVRIAAKDIAGRYGDAVRGVVFYGSCLRTGEVEDKVLDFYVIVDDYSHAYQKKWLAIGNKILPPNVFYHEMVIDGVTVRSKYAVLSWQDFAYRCSRKCLNVSVWARFCQPCLPLFDDKPLPDDKPLLDDKPGLADAFADIILEACATMFANALPLSSDDRQSRTLWVKAFELTYASELRSERGGKGLEIYLLDQDRYDRLAPLILKYLNEPETVKRDKQPDRGPIRYAKAMWFLRRANGKIVSFLRLIKASMTFDGGIDYLAWKITRHSGVEIEITDWMRKWPVIAGIALFWRLRRKGAFK